MEHITCGAIITTDELHRFADWLEVIRNGTQFTAFPGQPPIIQLKVPAQQSDLIEWVAQTKSVLPIQVDFR